MSVKGKGALIAEHLRHVLSMNMMDRDLLLTGTALESGSLPLIHQYGFAEFRQVENDYRLITTTSGVVQDETSSSPPPGASAAGNPGQRTAPLGSRSPTFHPPSEGAEAGARAREQLRASARLAEVVEEDARDLPLYFPQFTSHVLYDPDLRMWYREGWIQPLSWHPARFSIRFYYPPNPMGLPIILARPIRVPSPHLWKQQSNGKAFLSLCYTFAPDRTIDRRRDGDAATEVLRQVVLWLIKHMVWCRFGFWAGPEVGHDPVEVLHSTQPDDPCPTHSWQLYSECCRPAHVAEEKRRRPLRFGIDPAREVKRTIG